jgi:hypothetical protein
MKEVRHIPELISFSRFRACAATQIIVTLLFTGFVIACSTSKVDVEPYRSEAKAYCRAHTPEYWIQSGRLDELNALRPTEKAQALIKEFRLSIKSKEMREIIFDKGGKLPVKEFYPYLQKKIPELTGEPFDCPAIPEFYIAQ